MAPTSFGFGKRYPLFFTAPLALITTMSFASTAESIVDTNIPPDEDADLDDLLDDEALEGGDGAGRNF